MAVCDQSICLLEVRSSDSFSSKHDFGYCVSSASKPTLSLDPAQGGEGGGPLSVPQHRQENARKRNQDKDPADLFGFCLGVSCALAGSDSCCRLLPAVLRQRGACPSWLLCSGEQNWSLFLY